MKSAVTVSLVPETKGGPFVFTEGLADGCARAAELGFDAIEIFPPSAAAVDRGELRELLQRHRLQVAAFGTGAGWVVQKLTLTHPDSVVRRQAREFICALIELGAEFEAPAIIGSMQGRWDAAMPRAEALSFLAGALLDLGGEASRRGVSLLYEPLNRYETNLFNRVAEASAWLRDVKTEGVRLLADLFHMNIEETNTAAALRDAGPLVGHVHLADSNRRAMGMGQMQLEPIVSALRDLGYTGYLSAEILPLPDAMTAARQTMRAFREHVAFH